MSYHVRDDHHVEVLHRSFLEEKIGAWCNIWALPHLQHFQFHKPGAAI